MGGVFKAFASIFKSSKRKRPKTPEPTMPKAELAQLQRQRTLGAGHGGQTIMSGTSGAAEQAQTGKTLLGG